MVASTMGREAAVATLPLLRLVDPSRRITYGIVQAGEHVPGGVPYIRPVDMSDECGVPPERELQRTSPEIARVYHRSAVHSGDLVVSIGPSYGKVMIVPSSLDGANLTQGTARVAIDPNRAHPKFVFWCLRSPVCSSQWDAAVGGATFRALNLGPLSATRIPLLPLSNQPTVAAFLDRKTAVIDALIAKKERLIELLQDKRQALITQAVTKGLDPNVPMKDSGIEWIGEIPAHWNVVRIKYAARLESGHTPSRSMPEFWTEENDVPWVSLNDTKHLAANDYISDTAVKINAAGLSGSSAHMLPARTVVFTRDATIGETGIMTVSMAVSQHIIGWVCGPRLLPEYLLRVFDVMRPELERLTMGATLRTIGMPEVRSLSTLVPPMGEQEQIVARSNDELGRLARTRRAIDDQIGALRDYRQALVTAAVTGQIDVAEMEAAAS